MIEGPLQEKEKGTWISKLVITAKAWDKEKNKMPGERVQIRANLDCPLLNKVVYQTHAPIPTVCGGATTHTEGEHMVLQAGYGILLPTV